MKVKLTPKQEEAMNAVASEKYNFILFGGAIAGGKTFWGLSALLIMCQIFPKSRWCVVRENMERIRTTTIPSFKKLNASGKLLNSPYEYTHPNGSVILFKGENYDSDKDLNWLRGLEVNGILFEEINECQEETFDLSFSRVGRWECDPRPKPIVMATCNPTDNWVKKRIYDRWKTDTLPKSWLYIQSKITDNPNLTKEYIDNLNELPRYKYMMFVEGDWEVKDKTGDEFWHSFDMDKHVGKYPYNHEQTIHISLDNNVNPYVTCSIWQYENKKIKQIHEIAAKHPNNNAPKAAKLLVEWLNSINHTNVIYVYGDPSGSARSTVDENSASFFDKFIDILQVHGYKIISRIKKSMPQIALSSIFINEIYERELMGFSVGVDSSCVVSIKDYCSVKQDKDGGMLKVRVTDPKTKISYEPFGHFSDSKRYYFMTLLAAEFEVYKAKQNKYVIIAK